MRVVVVDDERPARQRLVRMLEGIDDVEVVGEAADADQLLALLAGTAVDLVLLDIQMPGLDGLALARMGSLPPIVFTTAHSEHAVEAFEVRAVDYLLKPIRAERLAVAVGRAREAAASATGVTALLETISQLAPVSPSSPRVTTTSRGETRIFEAIQITRFWSVDKYTVFSVDGKEYETDVSLTALEVRLAPHGFVRAHRAELVNTRHVRALRREVGALVLELTDGQEVSVSRRYTSLVRTRLGL